MGALGSCRTLTQRAFGLAPGYGQPSDSPPVRADAPSRRFCGAPPAVVRSRWFATVVRRQLYLDPALAAPKAARGRPSGTQRVPSRAPGALWFRRLRSEPIEARERGPHRSDSSGRLSSCELHVQQGPGAAQGSLTGRSARGDADSRSRASSIRRAPGKTGGVQLSLIRAGGSVPLQAVAPQRPREELHRAERDGTHLVGGRGFDSRRLH